MSRRRISRNKKLAFSLVTLLLVSIVTEGICYCGLRLSISGVSLRGLAQTRLNLTEGRLLTDAGNEVIHPYLGWIHNPELSPPVEINGREIHVNRLGLRDDGETLYKRNGGEFLLGIAGGSVAANLSWDAEEILCEALKAHPRLAGRTVRVVRMATPGYKQPQQLMLLNYLLALGGEFDAVVNIDGFNETSLTIQENVLQQTAMAYPRSWHARTLPLMDPRTSGDAYRLLELRARRQRMAHDLNASWLRWSTTMNLIWLYRDQQAVSELADLAIKVHDQRRTSFQNHGPKESFEDRAAMIEEVVAVWQRCSQQMHNLCAANDTIYLHVLQPNQYVPDSKVLTEIELDVAYDEKEGSCEVVRETFPLLIERGRALSAAGVEFSDQTAVFRDVEETMYVDPWCHFNQQGNEILAAEIAARLLEILDQIAPP